MDLLNEQKLALGIFVRAFRDLRSLEESERAGAMEWLTTPSYGFQYWCDILKMDPEAFRRGCLLPQVQDQIEELYMRFNTIAT